MSYAPGKIFFIFLRGFGNGALHTISGKTGRSKIKLFLKKRFIILVR
jgi:hypothetical protein